MNNIFDDNYARESIQKKPRPGWEIHAPSFDESDSFEYDPAVATLVDFSKLSDRDFFQVEGEGPFSLGPQVTNVYLSPPLPRVSYKSGMIFQPMCPEWEVSELPTVSVFQRQKAERKLFRKAKTSQKPSSYISGSENMSYCPYTILPQILFSESWRFHRCQDGCPGHQEVVIRRDGRRKVHHWVDAHTRTRNGRDERVRGHYRMSK